MLVVCALMLIFKQKLFKKKFEKKRTETLYVGCSRLQQKRRRIFVTAKTKVKKQRLQELRHFEKNSSSSDFESDSDTSTTVSSSDRQQSVSSGNECEDANEIPSFVERNIVSSPQSCPHSPNFSLSTVESNFSPMHSESETEDEKENSDIEGRLRIAGEKNFYFLICLYEIIAQSGTSDIEAGRWVKLMRTAFPEKNIPSYKTFRKRHAIGKSLKKKCIRECSEGSLYTLNYVDEIKKIVEENIYSIVSYSKSRSNDTDIKLSATFNNNS